MKTTVSEKGQVTIPKALRDKLGIRAGQLIDFRAEGGRLVGSKIVEDPVERVYGIVKESRTTDEIVADLRGF